MDRLAWERHALHHHELLAKAESNKVRNIAEARMWRLRREWTLRFLRRLLTVFHKGRFGRYNQPSSSVKTHRVVRRIHSTNES